MKARTATANELPGEHPSAWAGWVSRAMMLPPIVILAAITLRYFKNPSQVIAGMTLNTPEAITDTRVLGAFTLTLLIMLATSLAARERLWLGHLQLVAFMGLTLVVRIYGFMNDGTTLDMGNERTITIAESVFLVLNIAGLVLQSKQGRRGARL